MAPEKTANEEKLNFKWGPISKIVKAVNRLKKRGIKISANGIKTLKLSSNVSELVIHETPQK